MDNSSNTHEAILVILALILFIFMVLSFAQDDMNNAKRYNSFLHYSLGDFELMENLRILSKTQYSGWIATFTHQNGMEMQFGFSNHGHFGEQVAWSAGIIGISELANSIELMGHPNVFVTMHYQDDFSRGRFPQLINTRNGIRLSTITLQELVDDWGLTIYVQGHYNESQNGAKMLEITKKLVQAIAGQLMLDSINFEFIEWYQSQNPRRFVYYRQTGIFDEIERGIRP